MNRKKFLGTVCTVVLFVTAIFMLTPCACAQSKYKTLYTFTGGNDGNGPWTGVIFDAVGNLYGTTNGGGSGNGVVFKLTPTPTGRWTETVLHSFTGGADGGFASGSLIFDAAGNLYSTTGTGGAYGNGVVFELTPTMGGGWEESVLYAFTGGPDGGNSFAGMIFDPAGNLYATTWGGAYGNGVVFELTPTMSGGWEESVLYTFTNGSGGANPDAGLIFDGAGNLYGMTWYGGTYGNGVVLKLAPTSDGNWTESVLHQFTGGTDGAHPQFTGGKDGANPYVGVTFDSAGTLYGTTNGGGKFGYGVVFKLTPKSAGRWGYSVVYAFEDTPGSYPRGALVFDGAGNIYGTTYGDGTKTFGSVFEITP
jgi:uncharacterized repeat protein (TIGR03803 family)